MSDKNQDEDNAIFELLNGKSSWGVADFIFWRRTYHSMALEKERKAS